MLLGEVTASEKNCLILDTDDMVIEEYSLTEILCNKTAFSLIRNIREDGFLRSTLIRMLPRYFLSDDFIYVIDDSNELGTVCSLSVWFSGRKFEFIQKGDSVLLNGLFLDNMKFFYVSLIGLIDGNVEIHLTTGLNYTSYLCICSDRDVGLWLDGIPCKKETFLRECVMKHM